MTDATATTLPPKSSTAGRPASQPAARRRRGARTLLMFLLAAAVAAGAFFAWRYFSRPALPPGFAGGNGRLEANQLYVSTKYPGRIAEVLVKEGDTVDTGQVVARMDTTSLEAQLREAEAQIREAQQNRLAAQTEVSAKAAQYDFANKQYERSRGLAPGGAVSEREVDVDNAARLTNRAELAGARAQVIRNQAAIEAAQATADRLRSEIADAVLRAALRGRVESRLAEPGEVLGAGGRVFSVNDLSDVYMYVYLPEKVTGKVPLGSEARIVLDAAPQYPIRAYVAYVSPMAQFTPKTVETAEERHNLTFRVKLQVPRERLRQFEPLVKTGLPGMGYVRFDQSAEWPEKLRVKPVPATLWQPTGSSR